MKALILTLDFFATMAAIVLAAALVEVVCEPDAQWARPVPMADIPADRALTLFCIALLGYGACRLGSALAQALK